MLGAYRKIRESEHLTPRESSALKGAVPVGVERWRVDRDTVVFEGLNAMIVVRGEDFQEQIVVDVADANIETIFA
jgi:hypothetical protein